MKVDFAASYGNAPAAAIPSGLRSHVACETDRLTDVVLCPPHHLAPVPCCAVTRSNLEKGFNTCTEQALAQHDALVALLERNGVRCHMLIPAAGLADMCFTRDTGVATPFGLVALNPAMAHRRAEVEALLTACARWRLPVRRIVEGTIEGGDVCVARPGLLLIGMSGERSSAAGVEAFSAPFRAAGWEVLVCPFHADHLHLDTIFCMVDRDEAIGCIELLDPGFVVAVRQRGIRILPVPASSAATLGCNILALGGRRVIASAGDEEFVRLLRAARYHVETVDISQFAACGGGIHCLTQPIRRVAD